MPMAGTRIQKLAHRNAILFHPKISLVGTPARPSRQGSYSYFLGCCLLCSLSVPLVLLDACFIDSLIQNMASQIHFSGQNCRLLRASRVSGWRWLMTASYRRTNLRLGGSGMCVPFFTLTSTQSLKHLPSAASSSQNVVLFLVTSVTLFLQIISSLEPYSSRKA